MPVGRLAEGDFVRRQALAERVDGAYSIYDLACELLRECRDEVVALRENTMHPEQRVIQLALKAHFREVFLELNSEVLTATAKSLLQSLLEPEPAGPPLVVLARSAADALDEVLGYRLGNAARIPASGDANFTGRRNRDSFTLRPDDGIPRPVRDLKRHAAGKATAQLHHLPREPDEMVWLRLAREADLDGYEIEIRFDYWEVLGSLDQAEQIRVGTCHPNATLDDFGWKSVAPEEFFWVRPSSPAAQDELYCRMIHLAIEHRVDILVFPELSVPTGEAVRHRVLMESNEGGRPSLVLLGSCHLESDSDLEKSTAPIDGSKNRRWKLNRSELWFRNRNKPVTHDKFTPMRNWQGQREALSEPPTKRVTVLCSRHFNLSFLVCADFLAERTQRLITHLGVNLLLISAMSPNSVNFRTAIGNLVAHNQAIVIWANNPLFWPRDPAGTLDDEDQSSDNYARAASALFGMPSATDPVVFGDVGPPPGLLTWVVGSTTTNWLDLPEFPGVSLEGTAT